MIVVGYTAGSFGKACLEQGIVEARLRDTDLLLISAISESRGRRIADAEEIAAVEDRLVASGLRYTIRQPIGATPAEELLSAMDDDEAEMLVIGMRQRTQVGKLLLGSTSQYLLVQCHKPVLVVKPGVEVAPVAPESPADTAAAPAQSGDSVEP
jgi:nucleotide-binding universal stress UspA family protein